MLANRLPKSVPGTRYGAGSDASKKAAQIGARHPVLDKSSRLCGVRITALNCLSLLGFRKRKNNYFDNYSTFAGCSARGGGGVNYVSIQGKKIWLQGSLFTGSFFGAIFR